MNDAVYPPATNTSPLFGPLASHRLGRVNALVGGPPYYHGPPRLRDLVTTPDFYPLPIRCGGLRLWDTFGDRLHYGFIRWGHWVVGSVPFYTLG